MKTHTTLLLFLLCANIFADQMDDRIREFATRFKMTALEVKAKKNQALFVLGEKLFFEKEISGNKDVSCSTCHHPDHGTADALPLSIGVGAKGLAVNRVLPNNKVLIPRNSPPLFNLGLEGANKLFWDGRVEYDPIEEIFTTPEPALNDYDPEAWGIVKNLDSALTAQVMFPMLSHEEMRGFKGQNEIANAKTNLEAWNLITKRIIKLQSYKPLIKNAFPNEKEINIGHLAKAMAEFIRFEYLAINTPWDEYMRGDNKALTAKQRRGAIVFLGRGRCFVCHNGPHLTDFGMMAVAAPQLGPGKDIRNNDEGRFLITKRERDRYQFRTPPLRNVALTAPYFHAGAYQTLKEVIDHYEGGVKSLDNYDGRDILKRYKKNYQQNLFIETDRYKLFKKKEMAHPSMRARAIRLSDQEKDDLLDFISNALTDKSYLKK